MKQSGMENFLRSHYFGMFILLVVFADVIVVFGEVVISDICLNEHYHPYKNYEKWTHHMEETEHNLSIISKVMLFTLLAYQVFYILLFK
jgi:hypothetical protein